MELAYNRRLYGIAPLSDDRSLAASDFDRYTVVGPVSDRLGDAGGRVLDDQWNMNGGGSGSGAGDVFWTIPSDDQKEYNYWHGFDINANARTAAGLTLPGRREHRTRSDRRLQHVHRRHVDDRESDGGGTATGSIPSSLRVRAPLGLYTIPKVDVAVVGPRS